MKILTKLYKLYKKHLPDLILILAIFYIVFFSQYIPYVNLFVANFDPSLAGIVAIWIVYYFLVSPKVSKIFIFSLAILILAFPLVLISKTRAAEFLASLSYSMLMIGVIVEILNLRKSLHDKR